MNAEELTKRFYEVARHWRAGMTVWHRADGKRGVVVEWAIMGDGSVMVVVSFGVGTNWEKCLPCELSAVKVGDGTEGDEWKDMEETKR